MSILGYACVGSAMSVRSFSRIGSGVSALGKARLGCNMSILGYACVGNASGGPSITGTSRYDSCLSAFQIHSFLTV
jgi:hypothetical protein